MPFELGPNCVNHLLLVMREIVDTLAAGVANWCLRHQNYFILTIAEGGLWSLRRGSYESRRALSLLRRRLLMTNLQKRQ